LKLISAEPGERVRNFGFMRRSIIRSTKYRYGQFQFEWGNRRFTRLELR